VSTLRNAGLFLLLSVLWGTAFVAIKAGLEYLPPVLFAAVRYDVAGLLMLVYVAYATDYWLPRTRADWVTVLVGATLVIAAYNAFLFVGQQGVPSGVAAILIGMNPILATGFSRALLPDERLTVVGLVGLGLGFVGVGLVARPDPGNLIVSDLVAPGFVLLAAASVALGSVLMQRSDAPISTEGTVAWSCALGAVGLHAVSIGLPSETLADAELTTGAIVAVVYLAVLASAVGYVIYFDLLDRIGAIEINLVSYATPVSAAVAGWVVLNEALDPLTVVGFAVIFGGFVLLKRDAIRDRVGSMPGTHSPRT
jgi:drug/metabolite transporter (DMT)-like permease